MTVYAVVIIDWDQYSVEKVFMSRDLAESYVTKPYQEVEEFEVLETLPEIIGDREVHQLPDPTPEQIEAGKIISGMLGTSLVAFKDRQTLDILNCAFGEGLEGA